MAYGNGTATSVVGTVYASYAPTGSHGAGDLELAVTWYNNGTVAAFLGQDANVTTANGFPLFPGQAVTFDKQPWTTYTAITASGSADLRYWTESGINPQRQ